jgi:hypothetical protein
VQKQRLAEMNNTSRARERWISNSNSRGERSDDLRPSVTHDRDGRPPHSLGAFAQKRGASSTPACVMSAAMSFSSSSIFEPISSSARANQTTSERQRGAKRERDIERAELRNNRSWHSSGLFYCLGTRRVCTYSK